MAQHVYARLSGFGWTLLPHAPYRFERASDEPPTVVAHHGPHRVTLTFDWNPPGIVLSEGTPSLEEVLDLLEGPALDYWRIETTVFAARWPAGFDLASPPAESKPPFDLHGPGGALVWVQGPVSAERLPPVPEMAGAGQTVRRHGQAAYGSWVELDYLHEGVPWRQSHRVVPFEGTYALVVTAQAPAQLASVAEAAADEVASTIAPYPADTQRSS